MNKTRHLVGLATAAALFAVPAQAKAQLIDFFGGAVGCFYTGATACDPTSPFALSQTVAGTTGTLTFNTNTFVGTTSGIPGSVGFSGSCGVVGPCGAFGRFTINSASAQPNTGSYTPVAGQKFALELIFNTDCFVLAGLNCTPTVPHAGQPVTKGIITGSIVSNNGQVHVDWGPDQNFTFTGGGHTPTCTGQNVGGPVCVAGPWAGTATLTISTPTVISAGQNNFVTGFITVTSASPEPGTIALFATGLVGLIPVVRYRRRKA